jgi:hypothetical protein
MVRGALGFRSRIVRHHDDMVRRAPTPQALNAVLVQLIRRGRGQPGADAAYRAVVALLTACCAGRTGKPLRLADDELAMADTYLVHLATDADIIMAVTGFLAKAKRGSPVRGLAGAPTSEAIATRVRKQIEPAVHGAPNRGTAGLHADRWRGPDAGRSQQRRRAPRSTHRSVCGQAVSW